jgi:hypothetical protein
VTSAKTFNDAAKGVTSADLLQSISDHIDAASAESETMSRRRSHIRAAMILSNQLVDVLGRDVKEESRAFFGEMKLDIQKHDADVDNYIRRLIRPNRALIEHGAMDLSRRLNEARSLAIEVRDGNPRHQRPGEKEEHAWMMASRIGGLLAIAEDRSRQIMYLKTGKVPNPSPKK